MSVQHNDPPAPQSEVVTVTADNQTARVGAYTDTALTKRNVVSTAAASDLPAPPSVGSTHSDIRAVYANDKAAELDNTDAATENAAVDPPAHSPNSWARGTVGGRKVSRDPYANEGMVGQSFFKNQGGG